MGTNVEDIEKGEEEAEEEFDSSKAEQVKLVIDDCQRLLIPDLSSIIGCFSGAPRRCLRRAKTARP